MNRMAVQFLFSSMALLLLSISFSTLLHAELVGYGDQHGTAKDAVAHQCWPLTRTVRRQYVVPGQFRWYRVVLLPLNHRNLVAVTAL